MMDNGTIIDYNNKFDEEIKDLFVELQSHIVKLDKEKYNILTRDYREKYFLKTMDEIKTHNGKMLLYKKENKIIGLIVGIINNEFISEYDFQAPKRGRITELIVSEKYRGNGYGKLLLNEMENYLQNNGCKCILLGVFAYNENAINFYKKNGYNCRMIDMIKNNLTKL